MIYERIEIYQTANNPSVTNLQLSESVLNTALTCVFRLTLLALIVRPSNILTAKKKKLSQNIMFFDMVRLQQILDWT
jgi:hypothetical protein